MNILCLDIGGTQTRVALVGSGRVLEHASLSTPRGNSHEIVRQSIELLKRIQQRTAGRSAALRASAISIGCAGPVRGSRMEGSKPMELNETIDFSVTLRSDFDIPIFVANDLQMAVRAEKTYGKGRAIGSFALVTLSTGIGVGVVLGGKILENRIELGHSVVETDMRARFCQEPGRGHTGCWVSQASGSAIEAHLQSNGLKQTVEDYFSDPDPVFLRDLRLYNARGLTHVIHAFDPEKIIIMGSLGVNQFDNIIPSSDEIEDHCLLRPIPPIEKSSLGDDIGLLGAYEFAKERLCRV